MNRFEAVFHEEEPNERVAEWVVIEWTESNPETGWRGGRRVARYGSSYEDELAAISTAERMNKEYLQNL